MEPVGSSFRKIEEKTPLAFWDFQEIHRCLFFLSSTGVQSPVGYHQELFDSSFHPKNNGQVHLSPTRARKATWNLGGCVVPSKNGPAGGQEGGGRGKPNPLPEKGCCPEALSPFRCLKIASSPGKDRLGAYCWSSLVRKGVSKILPGRPHFCLRPTTTVWGP